MKFVRQAVTLTAALTMLASAASAQSRHTEHTFVLDDPEHRVPEIEEFRGEFDRL